jgi:elongator complex protein 2
LDEKLRGVTTVLSAHAKVVNSVRFFPTGSSTVSILLSGSADCSLGLWRGLKNENYDFKLVKQMPGHGNAVTRIAVLPGSNIFVTGSSDATVKIWKLGHDNDFSEVDIELLQTITLSPKYFPLAISLFSLDESSHIMAVGGTRSTIQIFVSRDSRFSLAATLTGHEGWIRALAFTRETEKQDSDILLASASQDKYIRLWRVHRGEELPQASGALNDPALGVLGKSLSNKAHRFESALDKYSVTFEALLLGHEDWIYTASWRHRDSKLQLLTTSEDNSLAIWEPDINSGVWICATRLGEISAQKGSTTATGSAGGFWIGLWSPDSNSVVSLGRTGSWRMWNYSAEKDLWAQHVAITGHTKEVKGICWSRDGSYLLSTSSDQTTRLFAQWRRGEKSSWHEFSRPQIHGYDLNCIDSITNSEFISGADEKLLRVFDEPRGVATMLDRLCRIKPTTKDLPDAANIPVLGLSNKAIQAVDDDTPLPEGEPNEREAVDPASIVRKSTLDFDHPPFEDHLARHLLWPETEKLYGHGYEISAVATSNDGKLVATACRASSIDHAVIRLYDTKEWLEIKPPLKAHTLTVTALHFSPDDQYLLSVGRDRQWAVFHRDTDANTYSICASDPKGHTRMILDASWAPLDTTGSRVFATAGRDKSVKIWQFEGTTATCKNKIASTAAVTAVAFLGQIVEGKFVLAYGTEIGEVGVCRVDLDLGNVQTEMVDRRFCSAKPVTQLAWRPGMEDKEVQLAVASDDTSVRILRVE